MSRFICTSCSKNKSLAEGLLPAIERYTASRIHEIYKLAELQNLPFVLLSGEYGLISHDHPIPWYDHRLEEDEVDQMVEKVASQLKDLGAKTLEFHGRDEQTDHSWKPYWDVIRKSTSKAGVKLDSKIYS